MKLRYTKDLKIALALVLVGQLVFFVLSSRLTTPSYTSRIYATTGVKHQQEDLHKLNEAAHYFGQTMIGWLKFPNFMNQLREVVELPESASMSAHIQERQNIIFAVTTKSPIEFDLVKRTGDFIQSKIDGYNESSLTQFTLTNLDYEQVESRMSYQFGAFVALIVSLLISLAISFMRREFKHIGGYIA